MKRYLKNRWVRIAIALFALGSVPLAAVAFFVLVAPWAAPALVVLEGLWLVTLWPAVLCLAGGIVQVRGQAKQ